MKIKINLDTKGYTEKPDKNNIGIISHRTRQARAQREITPAELIKYIKHGYTFTPGVIGGDPEEWKPKNAEGKREELINPATGLKYRVSDFWEAQQIIAADIDNDNGARLTPAEALAICRENGIDPFCIYKTFSYTPEHERFRVLVILDRAITDFTKAYDLIGRFVNLFNEFKTSCADTSIEPAKLIYGGREDSIIYTADRLTPIETIEALPQAPKIEPTTTSNAKTSNNTPISTNASEGDILEALSYTNYDPDNYADWVNIGNAIKHSGYSFDIWAAWSSKSAKYDYHDALNKWDNDLTETGAITVNTIFYYANQNPSYKELLKRKWREEHNAAELREIATALSFEEQSAADPTPEQGKGTEQGAEDIKQDPTPANNKSDPLKSAAEYMRGGGYDADITDMQQYAGRKMNLHSDIDRYLTLYPGLAILGGQASLGKTTFCINAAAKLIDRGEHVLYFALEQKTDELLTKFVARYIFEQDNNTDITNIDLLNGRRDAVISDYMADLSDKLENLYIINCDFDTTAEEIITTANKHMQLTGVRPIVIIDYLQIIAPPVNFKGSRMEYIDENLKTLKKWQKNTRLFVLLISSFNRANNYEPVSYESFLHTSAIEFTCDYVWGLHLQILDPDNEEFYTRTGPNGGRYELKGHDLKKQVQAAQQENPKKVQFVSLKNRKGRQLFKANFDYYPAHDYFKPDFNALFDNANGKEYKDIIFEQIEKSRKRNASKNK